jgi:LysM repeat protein
VAGAGGFAKGSIQRWQSPARSVKVRIPQSRAAGRIGPTLQIAAAPQSRGRIPRFLAVAALATIVAAVAIVVATARRSGGSHRKPNTSVHATVRKLPPYWTVRPGDTLTKISDKTRLTIRQLEAYNRNIAPQSIIPGQRVNLWRHPPSPRPKPPGPRFWTVRPGDSYGSIAAKTGINLARLEHLNPRLKPATLQPRDLVRLRP